MLIPSDDKINAKPSVEGKGLADLALTFPLLSDWLKTMKNIVILVKFCCVAPNAEPNG